MKHIKLFENYRLEESYNAAFLQGLALDIMKISDPEEIAEILFNFFVISFIKYYLLLFCIRF